MMTFKELKKLVKLPLYKEQRVPTVKALEESGVSVVAEKILENHGSISVYQNGYVIYRAHKRVTVFSLRNCVHYKYDALEGAGHHIEEEEFDEYEWHIRLVLEGEDRIFMNYEIIQGKWMPSREDREYKEEILEGVDEAVSTLERMISEERVEELLSTLTDLQRKVVHIHLFHGLSFTEAAKHLGMTRQNLTGIYNAAIYKIEDLEKQAEAIRVEQIKLYESYADGVLLRDAYIEKKKALSEKLAALQDSIRTEKEEQECADELDEEIRALTKQASEKTYIGGLTKECVDAFVSMVYLYDDQTMKIEFNCEDVIRRALEKYGA